MPTDLTPEARQTLRRLAEAEDQTCERIVEIGAVPAAFLDAAYTYVPALLDALDAAEAERDKLREALRPFADIAAALPADAEDDGWLANCLTEFNDPLVAAVRRAAAALRPE